MFYDPMIAKLVTWAPTREEAIDAQIAALDQFVIDGISDNVDFLSALMQHPRFRAGDLTTGFIAEEYPDGFDGAPADAQLIEDLTAIAGMVAVITDDRAVEISDQLGDRPHFPCERVVQIARRDAQGSDQALQGRHARGHGRRRPRRHRRALEARPAAADRQRRWARSHRPGRAASAATGSCRPAAPATRCRCLSPHVADLARHMIEKVPPDLSRFLLAPMPGLLTKLDVAVGDKVEPGQPVAVMEAMKMENILRAPKAATVKATPAKAGDSLAVDQVIVEFE